MEFPTLIRDEPIYNLGVLGGIFHSYSHLNRTFSKQKVETLIKRHVLHCFPLFHKMSARLIWINVLYKQYRHLLLKLEIIHYLRNKLDFWKVRGIMNTSGILQSPKGFTLHLQETRIVHDSKNIPKIKFISYIYILL